MEHQNDPAFGARLRSEIDRWEREGVVSAEIAAALRERYPTLPAPPVDEGRLVRRVMYLATTAFLAAFFSFAGSAALGPAIRVAILLAAAAGAILGGRFVHAGRRSEGSALLVLGGALVPIAFYFAVHHHRLWEPATPYLWWAALATASTVGFGFAARRLDEPALGGAAVVSAVLLPVALALHGTAGSGVFAPLAGLGALACSLACGRLGGPFAAPLRFATSALSVAAVVLPVGLRCFDSLPAASAGFAVALAQAHRTRARGGSRGAAFAVLAAGYGVVAFATAAAIAPSAGGWIVLAFSATAVGLALAGTAPTSTARGDALAALLLLLALANAALAVRSDETTGPAYAVALHVAAALLLHGLALRVSPRPLLAWLGTAHLGVAVLLLRPAGVEAWSVPVGLALLVDSEWFAAEPRAPALVLAVAVLAVPSFVRSFGDDGALRSVLLALLGIALTGMGAAQRRPGLLRVGMAVLVPALFTRIAAGLAALGVPRFVWLGMFGALLAGIAFVLQRRSTRDRS